MQITALASGSNGNCYYVGNEQEAILVDAGISCKQILLRLEQLNLDINKIKGIFITHDHGDHTRGITVLLKKYQIPVYMTKGMYDEANVIVPEELQAPFEIGKTINLGNLHIESFLKQHDGVDPCGFIVTNNNKKVAVITDLGIACENVKKVVSEVDALFLESNYDNELLSTCGYPYFLQQRISSDVGHLSNDDAAELITTCASAKLTHIFLSHLSANSNHPQKALDTMQQHIQKAQLKTEIILTSRLLPSKLVTLK